MKLTSSLFGARPSRYSSSLLKGKLQCTRHRRGLFNLPNLPSFSPFGGSSDENGSGGSAEQTYHERKIMPYTRKQLYNLVADVDNYRHFIPYCTDSTVHSSQVIQLPRSAQTVEKKQASLTVGFLAFKESYLSEVTCTPFASVEAVASSRTPLFKKLVTTWRFQPGNYSSPHPTSQSVSNPDSNTDSSETDGLDGPTLLSIDLAFEFSNPIYAGVSSAFFKQVSAMMVRAFEERCMEVYGRGTK